MQVPSSRRSSVVAGALSLVFLAAGPASAASPAPAESGKGSSVRAQWHRFAADGANLSGLAIGSAMPIDFNGNGFADYAVVRNTGGGPSGQVTWFIRDSSTGAETTIPWGLASDFFVPADYDGDGATDLAVWRSGAAGTAAFYILQSSTGTPRIVLFGQTGDDPTVVADYDGDGKDDPAVYRPGAAAGQQSTWFYLASLSNPSNNVTYIPWGLNGDFPMPGDVDGDGKADFTIQRSNGGGQARFWTLTAAGAFQSTVFGTPTDVMVPGDYDGDGKTDIAVVRGIGGAINWFVLRSSDSTIRQMAFGLSATDFPTHADYDGDGKIDHSIWRPNADSTQNYFWVFRSATSAASPFEWGQNGDYPVANYNSH